MLPTGRTLRARRFATVHLAPLDSPEGAAVLIHRVGRKPPWKGGYRGRAGEIRTHDLLHPMQAFYQAELRPDLFAGQKLPGWGRG
jgi:hypothetical protein